MVAAVVAAVVVAMVVAAVVVADSRVQESAKMPFMGQSCLPDYAYISRSG